MRKTLFAMLGLVAIGLWAMPVVAAPSGLPMEGPGKVRPDPVPLENRAGAAGAVARGETYQGTLSGSLIKQSSVVTTTFFLYPGACVQRSLGTWAAKANAVADSLQPNGSFPNSSGYIDNQPDPANNLIAYTRADLSLPEKLWHVANTSDPVAQRPEMIDDTHSHMLWCGKYDVNYVIGPGPAGSAIKADLGYPNITYQILYIDTGNHSNASGTYALAFDAAFSSEQNYDYEAIIGGGAGDGTAGSNVDPLQNRRDLIDDMMPPAGVPTAGPNADSDQIVTFTGSQQSGASITQNHDANELLLQVGDASADPVISHFIITIDDDHRAIYVVFTADCLVSSEDGIWPNGNGQMMDNITVTNTGVTTTLYAGNATFVPPAGVRDTDTVGGTVIVWSGAVVPDPGDDFAVPIISSRVPPGVGERWQLAPGTENQTSDICSPQKALPSELFFEGGDATTNLAVPKQYNAVVPCTFPIPNQASQVLVFWNEYLDLPRFSGYVQYAEFRIFKQGTWGNWDFTSPGGGVTTGSLGAWVSDGDDISTATSADSVQVRFDMQCIAPFAADRVNCVPSQVNPLLYDDFRLQVVAGTGALPFFGIFPGSVAQTTFVDGRIGSTVSGPPTNCGNQVNKCWPGNRGSGLGQPLDHNIAVNDNWNQTLGDSIDVNMLTGLRKNGMGINWLHGFDKNLNAGELGPPGSEYARTNGSHNFNCDVPRMIFRLFDPTSKTWSPWDSTEMVASAVSPGPTDTTVVDSDYNMNWPPFDKQIANTGLPNGFTINGINNYNALRFLPRGTRMQYYFKAVDIGNGTGTGCGVTYQFTSDNRANETEDLPILPNSSVRAPDIIEFRVLPSVYPPGPAGSLLAGRTTTPILNLESAYTNWGFGYDAMTQALRGLGVRADRYRHLSSGTTANGFGGHELPGRRPDRLSNFFPNYLEYPLVDSLAAWYRIIIESGHTTTRSTFNEEDASTMEQWWRKETGTDGGDRCAFTNSDDGFFYMITPSGVANDLQLSMASQVFGVAAADNSWAPVQSYFNMNDKFIKDTSGPTLVDNPNAYPVDGGCPTPNKFDALTKVADADAFIGATFPSGQAASVGRMRDLDNIGDRDRNKALAYGMSIQFIRDPAIGSTSPNYTRSGIENRMRVMYKFLTSCRGDRAGQVSTSVCFPCPNPLPETALSMSSEWATQSTGFQTTTYGPLYPIQAGSLATGVPDPSPEAAPRINKIDGNYPNPFNPHTAIRFSSAQAGKAEIRIFSVSGALVRTLHSTVTVGPNEVRWNGKKDDGTALASGVYFYKLFFPGGEVLTGPNHLVLVK
jgi:flagellar hook capping protein FlgD